MRKFNLLNWERLDEGIVLFDEVTTTFENKILLCQYEACGMRTVAKT
ncbi:MAG: hypothetical protein WCD45_01400 [Gallionella sp.]